MRPLRRARRKGGSPAIRQPPLCHRQLIGEIWMRQRSSSPAHRQRCHEGQKHCPERVRTPGYPLLQSAPLTRPAFCCKGNQVRALRARWGPIGTPRVIRCKHMLKPGPERGCLSRTGPLSRLQIVFGLKHIAPSLQRSTPPHPLWRPVIAVVAPPSRRHEAHPAGSPAAGPGLRGQRL